MTFTYVLQALVIHAASAVYYQTALHPGGLYNASLQSTVDGNPLKGFVANPCTASNHLLLI